MSQDQTPAKKPEIHPKVNEYLKSAAYIAALFTFLTPWFTNWIIPNWAMFLVLPNFLTLVLNFYLWHRNRRYIYGPFTQQTCVINVVMCVWMTISYFTKGDSYNIIIASEWLVSALGWGVYSCIASYEMFQYIFGLELSISSSVKWDDLSANNDRMHAITANIIDVIKTLSKNDELQNDSVTKINEAVIALSKIDELQNELQNRHRRKILLLILAEIEKVAKKTATKLAVKKSELLNSKLFPVELKQLLNEAKKTPSDSTKVLE